MKQDTFDPTAIKTPISEDLEIMWKEARLGKFTSSEINKLRKGGRRDMTEDEYKAEVKRCEESTEKPKPKPRKTVDIFFGDGAITYIMERVGEALTLQSNDVTTRAMEWGNEHEEGGFNTFVNVTGKKAIHYGKKNPVFFPYAEDEDHAGGSPDFDVPDEDAIGEIKCPFETSYHIKVLLAIQQGTFNLKEFNEDYYAQVQANLLFTGRKKAYFVSYDPRVLEMKYAVAYAEIERDEVFIADLKARIDEAIKVKKSILGDIGFYEEAAIAA